MVWEADDFFSIGCCGAFAEAEATHGSELSSYERQEMYNFDEIFYIGSPKWKKQASPDKPTNNFGFDDERGDYIVIDHDHLGYRYEIMDLLGRGSFGQVLQCKDHKTGKSVAIKLIRNKKRFHHQALVEVKILENLTKWVSVHNGAGKVGGGFGITLTNLVAFLDRVPVLYPYRTRMSNST